MEKKNIVRRKSYTAMFKPEVVDFVKEKGNREAARKFNVGETSTSFDCDSDEDFLGFE
jgi:transposase-like protein